MEVVIIALLIVVGKEFFRARKLKLENRELERTVNALQKAYDSQTRLLHKAQVDLSECKANAALEVVKNVDINKITDVPGAY